MSAISLSNLGCQLVLVAVTALVALAIHRLYLSPLAKFPGPKLAAVTTVYEGYYDCLKDGGGRYFQRINQMHDKYGPIVRISPRELHIRDPDWNEIYKVTRRASKYQWYYQTLGSIGNAFSTVDAETHRMRRDAIQPYFSPAAVARHEPEIERLVGKVIGRLRQFKGQDRLVNLGDVFRCLATDAATAFAFRQPFGHLDSPDFEHVPNDGVRKFGRFSQFNRHSNAWIMTLAAKMPRWLALKLNPSSLGVAGFFKQLAVVIQKELGSGAKLSIHKAEEEEAEQNMIHQILTSNLPPEEKSPWRVARECAGVTLAGTETTGSTLGLIAYLLLANPDKAAKLQAELGQAYKTHGRPPTYRELKELPYLSAVINEGLRMGGGVSGRLPRFDPRQDIRYKEWVIPRGTIISTTTNDTNFSPTLFPSPYSFLPERWLESSSPSPLPSAPPPKLTSRYMLPFGRGTRICLGMEMALMEMYLAVGRVFGPTATATTTTTTSGESGGPGFSLELEQGIEYERDVKMFHDYFSPFPRSWRGIKVFVK